MLVRGVRAGVRRARVARRFLFCHLRRTLPRASMPQMSAFRRAAFEYAARRCEARAFECHAVPLLQQSRLQAERAICAGGRLYLRLRQQRDV